MILIILRKSSHVGDHQQQALGAGEGCGQGTNSQGTVEGTSHTSLRLHLSDLWGCETGLQGVTLSVHGRSMHGSRVLLWTAAVRCLALGASGLPHNN